MKGYIYSFKGRFYGGFRFAESAEFAGALLQSYDRLNARIAERNRAARREALSPGVDSCSSVDDKLDATTLALKGYSMNFRQLKRESSFVTAMREQHAALKARRDAEYGAELVPLSTPEYRFLEVGETICEGDQVDIGQPFGVDGWVKVTLLLGERVLRARAFRRTVQNYRFLKPGEMIQAGDEVKDAGMPWKKSIAAGFHVHPACTPNCFRRPIACDLTH